MMAGALRVKARSSRAARRKRRPSLSEVRHAERGRHKVLLELRSATTSAASGDRRMPGLPRASASRIEIL